MVRVELAAIACGLTAARVATIFFASSNVPLWLIKDPFSVNPNHGENFPIYLFIQAKQPKQALLTRAYNWLYHLRVSRAQ